MSNPFDYVSAINSTKKDLMNDTGNDELAEAGYIPFITNRALSYFPDTILYANEMNINKDLDNKLQFHYLINNIRPKKRFSKWAKRQDDNDIEAIMAYYGYNRTKAESIASLLTPDQLKEIKRRMDKGGRRNE